jgi:hypothetical protein
MVLTTPEELVYERSVLAGKLWRQANLRAWNGVGFYEGMRSEIEQAKDQARNDYIDNRDEMRARTPELASKSVASLKRAKRAA